MGSFCTERTYERLLGNLGGGEPAVWAECLFADPVADVAVLGSPDDFSDEADGYHALTEPASILRIGKAHNGRGWVLSLDAHWIPITLELDPCMWGPVLEIDPTEAGMSGSPILNNAGQAVGVVVIGSETTSRNAVDTNERAGPQPVLTHDLPGWLLLPHARRRAPRRPRR